MSVLAASWGDELPAFSVPDGCSLAVLVITRELADGVCCCSIEKKQHNRGIENMEHNGAVRARVDSQAAMSPALTMHTLLTHDLWVSRRLGERLARQTWPCTTPAMRRLLATSGRPAAQQTRSRRPPQAALEPVHQLQAGP